jgi:hypothetical protein
MLGRSRAEPAQPCPTLSGLEMAADKVLALFRRAQARDFVDPLAIEPRYGLDRVRQLSAKKTVGLHTPAMLAAVLGRFGRLRRQEFGIDEFQYEQLSREVETWRASALSTSPDAEGAGETSDKPGVASQDVSSRRRWVQNGYARVGTRGFAKSRRAATESAGLQRFRYRAWPFVDGRASFVVVS